MLNHLPTLLPLHGLHVTLRFTAPTRLKTVHAPALGAFIRHLAGSPARFDELVKIAAPPSQRGEQLLGDCYRFSVYGLNGSAEILERLCQALPQLPFAGRHYGRAMPFGDNLCFEQMHDAFAGQVVQRYAELTPYGATQLRRDCAAWQGVGRFRLRWLSPARLLRDKQQRQHAKGEMRYCQQRSDLSGDLLANRLHDYFAALLQKHSSALPPRAQPATLELLPESQVYWQDAHYTDAEGKHHAIGGMLGELWLSVADPARFDWSPWLLGQYTGIGQRSAFGLGRYVLVGGGAA